MSFTLNTNAAVNFEDILSNRGKTGVTIIKKFGRAVVGTTPTPICFGGFYRTPQSGSGVNLRVAAGNANDAPGGSGARKIMLQGIAETTGDYLEEEIVTNGDSAGSASSNKFLRLFRAYVTESGSYADQTTGSHSGDITIQDAATSDTWAVIDSTSVARAQSEIGVFTVPTGYEAYMGNIGFTSNANKTVNIELFQRGNILETSAPYTARREFGQITSIDNQFSLENTHYYGPFREHTDFGAVSYVNATTAVISIFYTIILITPSAV